jgi:hypothetical protein
MDKLSHSKFRSGLPAYVDSTHGKYKKPVERLCLRCRTKTHNTDGICSPCKTQDRAGVTFASLRKEISEQ